MNYPAELVEAAFAAADAAIDVVHGNGDHHDLTEVIERYDRLRNHTVYGTAHCELEWVFEPTIHWEDGDAPGN